LIDPDTSLATAILKPIPTWDHRLRDYSSASCVWSTVTPVVLPGHEDPGGVRQRLNAAPDADAQRRLLLRLQQRVDKAEVVGREVGFRRGVEHARRYLLPRELTTSRYHVRVKWPSPVSGPISIGAGRYRGLGVFVAENSSYDTE